MKKKYTYLIVIFLISASCSAYGQILGNGFINFDDTTYITENNYIKSGINPESIKWAFSAVVCNNWHPLTLISHILDWSLFGANASGHHLINLLLHIGSVLFLFFFFEKATKNLWSSAFVAAFFALHPLRVESVAWAAERKDVLSMFFGLASMYAYACYIESSKLPKYFLCLILFALSLMAKPMLVTLPFVLLLLDYWPLERWQKASPQVIVPVLVNKKAGKGKNKQRTADSIKERKISTPLTGRSPIMGTLLWEKAPFIFLTIVSSIATFWAQNKSGAVMAIEQMSFPLRFANAIISCISYLEKTFRPVDLAVFYPHEHSFPLWQILLSCFILIVITSFVIYAVRKLPFLFVGWFWYLGTLIPVIGLVQVGGQAMADRYTYLPSIGIAIMLAWGMPHLFQREDMRKKILFPAGIATLAILGVLTWQQCGYWKNSIVLFGHALEVTKGNYLAYNNRGIAYAELGQFQSAIEDYNHSLQVAKDNNYIAHNNRGIAYAELGQFQSAIEDYNETIRLEPGDPEGYYNRGNAYTKLGQYQLAIEDYNKAIELKPDVGFIYNNRGLAYLFQGNNELGCPDAQKACVLGNCRLLEMAKDKGACR